MNYSLSYFIPLNGRVAGIEPASSPWQREILPLNHTRIFFVLDIHLYIYRYRFLYLYNKYVHIFIYAWLDPG
jgi:hypothetical protein